MSIIIKSFSVGSGDMFYIKHNVDSFSIIDCCMDEHNREGILRELLRESQGKIITRFISTHPDDDHIRGLEYLNQNMPIENFYCVENRATKWRTTDDFNEYCSLRDSGKAFYLKGSCQRKWLNESDYQRCGAGINILWPDTSNEHYKVALQDAIDGSPNNICPIVQYSLEHGVTALWMGDLETDFMKKIGGNLYLPKVDILFAPHHGRDSGKIPESWLRAMDPKVVVVGEAPSEHLNYYGSYNTIKQNSAGAVLFECVGEEINVYAEKISYSEDFLQSKYRAHRNYGLRYIGTLTCHAVSARFLSQVLRSLSGGRNFL